MAALRMGKKVYDGIVSHAKSLAPVEACGYCAGDGAVVSLFVPLANADNSTEHFSFDPAEQFDAVRSIRDLGLKVMAVYHSHPVSPARPSQEDIRLAYDPGVSWVIVSLAGGIAMKSFRITHGVPAEEIILVE